MRPELSSAIAEATGKPWPEMVAATQALYAPLHERPPYVDVTVDRDRRYGTHERQRLDVFHAPQSSRRPAFVYVHGGGFTGGDKRSADGPYYDNVGLWAVRNGFVGVTITYRLAPDARYPSGGEDVGEALAWVHEHISGCGGDPRRIVVMGQSAGAAHVATYIAGADPDTHARHGVRGAVCSRVYTISTRTL